MTISLYDLSVSSYLQNLAGLSGSLEKGAKFCDQAKIDPNVLVETRLYPNMLPFRFQIVSVVHHSIGAIRNIEKGNAGIPPSSTVDYPGLQKMIADTILELEALLPDEVNALGDRELIFERGELKLPFVGQDFIRSFSLPNFYFHSVTAHDILRSIGVPIGKRDYLGIPKMKS